MSNTETTFSEKELTTKAERDIERRRENGEDQAVVKTLSDIETKEILWLWDKYIALGKLTLFAGDPGIGKGLFVSYIAAHLSLGKPFFDKSPCPTGDTIIVTNEDDAGDTIKPRLNALGADLKRIHIIEGIVTKSERKPISLKNIEALMDAADQIRIANGKPMLLVFDPVEDFMPGINIYRNNSVRESIQKKLLDFISKSNIALIFIQHLNKSNKPASYRIGGSIAFSAMARAAYILAKDPQIPEKRLFLPLKNNLAEDIKGFQYSIRSTQEHIPYIELEKEVYESIDDVLGRNFFENKRVTPEQKQILDLLDEKFPKVLSTHAIAEQLGKKTNNVSQLLQKLLRAGMVENPKNGYWRSENSVNSANSSEKDDAVDLTGDETADLMGDETAETAEFTESSEGSCGMGK
jgi:hypothetical protein